MTASAPEGPSRNRPSSPTAAHKVSRLRRRLWAIPRVNLPAEQRDSTAIPPAQHEDRGRTGRRGSEAEDRPEISPARVTRPKPASGLHVEVYEEGPNIDRGERRRRCSREFSRVSPTETAAGARLETQVRDWNPRCRRPRDGRTAPSKQRDGDWRQEEIQKRKGHRDKPKTARKHEPARAYQFGNTVSTRRCLCDAQLANRAQIIVEDEDGEVVQEVRASVGQAGEGGPGAEVHGHGLAGQARRQLRSGGPSGEGEEGGPSKPRLASVSAWAGAFRPTTNDPSAPKPKQRDGEADDDDDDRRIRFTIGGVGRRMTKDDFLEEMQKYDKRTRREIVEHSNASEAVKSLARGDVKPHAGSASAKPDGRADAGVTPRGSSRNLLRRAALRRVLLLVLCQPVSLPAGAREGARREEAAPRARRIAGTRRRRPSSGGAGLPCCGVSVTMMTTTTTR